MKKWTIIWLTIMLLAGSSCTGDKSTPTPDIEATMAVALAQTLEAQPTVTETVPPTATLTATPEPTATSTPTALPTETATQEVGAVSSEKLDNGWTRYRYHDYGFQISLPPNWTHLDLTVDDFDEMLSYAQGSNEQLGSVFSSDYLRNLAATGIKCMAVDSSVDSLSSGVPTSMNITVAELPMDIPFDDYVAINVQQLSNIFDIQVEIEQERTTIDEVEAERLSYEVALNDVFGQPQVLYYNQYLMLIGRDQYLITFGTLSKNAGTNQPIFDEIVQSFEFIP